MASILYEIEFDWNDFLGYSVLQNPLELIGLVIILITIILVFLNLYKLSKSYQQTKLIETLYWALGFGGLFISIISLILEKLAFSTLGSDTLGELMAIIALISSGAAWLFFSLFSFRTTYPERVKPLGALVLLLVIIYLGALCFSILAGPPYADVIEYELVYLPTIDLIVYVTLIPTTLISPIIFFYFASKTRTENIGNSNRALWMGIGTLAFSIGYLAEVVPFFPAEVSIPLRVLFIFSALVMYLCFSMPDWFKKRIGWVD